jgi:Carboxypeptidase regulatory-like domain
MSGSPKILFVLALLVFVPVTAHAQGSIAGIVKDTSGAVLPGVTVEAASPVLIEKARSVVTDGTGQYSIVDLRPGVYTVSFTLPGFSTIRREGIELAGSFTATVNADMRVGAVEETITVTGETPIVDIQSTTRERVIDHAVIDTIPTGRLPTQLAILIPGVTTTMAAGFNGMGTQDVGGAGGDQSVRLFVHGGKDTDFRVTQNGLSVASLFRPDYDMSYTPNLGATQEVTVDTSGASAQSSEGGVRINLIPKEGGNTFHGTFFASYANESMAGSNFNDDLRARGFATPNTIKRVGDINPCWHRSHKNPQARCQAAETLVSHWCSSFLREIL